MMGNSLDVFAKREKYTGWLVNMSHEPIAYYREGERVEPMPEYKGVKSYWNYSARVDSGQLTRGRCEYCKSKLLDNDRRCPSCGAPA